MSARGCVRLSSYVTLPEPAINETLAASTPACSSSPRSTAPTQAAHDMPPMRSTATLVEAFAGVTFRVVVAMDDGNKPARSSRSSGVGAASGAARCSTILVMSEVPLEEEEEEGRAARRWN